MEKKIRQFDKIISDWKRKADGLAQELDQSQKECRNVAAELFRVTNGYTEASNHLSEVRRENAALTDEIKDIIRDIIGQAEELHVHGAKVASISRWREQALITDKVKETFPLVDYPELYKASTKSRLNIH